MFSVLRRTFGTLRWKLAASYVAVTMLVILVLEAVLVVIAVPVVTRIAMPALAEVFAEGLAAQMQFDFVNPQGRDERLGAQLRALLSDSGSGGSSIMFPLEQSTDGQTTRAVNFPSELDVTLLDESGAVITGTTRLATEQGRSYRETLPDVTHELIAEVLDDSAETRDSRHVTRTDGGYYGVAAVRDESQGVIGAVVVNLPGIRSIDFVRGLLQLFLVSAAIILVFSGAIGLLFGLMAGSGFSHVDSIASQLLPAWLSRYTFAIMQADLLVHVAGGTAQNSLAFNVAVLAVYLFVPLVVAAALFRRRDIAG